MLEKYQIFDPIDKKINSLEKKIKETESLVALTSLQDECSEIREELFSIRIDDNSLHSYCLVLSTIISYYSDQIRKKMKSLSFRDNLF